jgi:hypothetical protein
MLETHLAGKITEKRQNFDPSTPSAGAENLHFTLNREVRRALRPPDVCVQMALGRRGQGEISGTWYFQRQPWARSA